MNLVVLSHLEPIYVVYGTICLIARYVFLLTDHRVTQQQLQ